MRQSMTAVLERNLSATGPGFTTEPYEAAWAGEARWFVRAVRPGDEGVRVSVAAQVSPDGLHWCDLEEPRELGESLVSWESTGFGGWLRLRGEVTGGDSGGDLSAGTLMIYLALKS